MTKSSSILTFGSTPTHLPRYNSGPPQKKGDCVQLIQDDHSWSITNQQSLVIGWAQSF
jgi:hypothetical protein